MQAEHKIEPASFYLILPLLYLPSPTRNSHGPSFLISSSFRCLSFLVFLVFLLFSLITLLVLLLCLWPLSSASVVLPTFIASKTRAPKKARATGTLAQPFAPVRAAVSCTASPYLVESSVWGQPALFATRREPKSTAALNGTRHLHCSKRIGGSHHDWDSLPHCFDCACLLQ